MNTIVVKPQMRANIDNGCPSILILGDIISRVLFSPPISECSFTASYLLTECAADINSPSQYINYVTITTDLLSC